MTTCRQQGGRLLDVLVAAGEALLQGTVALRFSWLCRGAERLPRLSALWSELVPNVYVGVGEA